MNLDLYDLRRREVQALGAALSCRNWHMMETAYNSLRDKLDNAGFHIGAASTAEAASGAGEREGVRLPTDAAEPSVSYDEARYVGMVLRLINATEEVLRISDRQHVAWDEARSAITLLRSASLPPATDPAKETVAFVQHWLMSSDHEPTQWDRDFAAAIDARCKLQPTDADIQAMAERFCSTPLPWSVASDACATAPAFDRTGTNLLTVAQATEMLRAALAAAPTIPATGEVMPEGMKPWHGGDAAPNDLDLSGRVLREDGQTEAGRDVTIQQWKRPVPRCKWNIIAYTPKPTIPATGHAATEGEG